MQCSGQCQLSHKTAVEKNTTYVKCRNMTHSKCVCVNSIFLQETHLERDKGKGKQRDVLTFFLWDVPTFIPYRTLRLSYVSQSVNTCEQVILTRSDKGIKGLLRAVSHTFHCSYSSWQNMSSFHKYVLYCPNCREILYCFYCSSFIALCLSLTAFNFC